MDYAEAFALARELSRTALEDIAYEMAIIDKNPTMVIFMLKAADPQRYRERVEKVDWNGDLSKLKPDQIDTILKQLRAELGYPDDYMPETTQCTGREPAKASRRSSAFQLPRGTVVP